MCCQAQYRSSCFLSLDISFVPHSLHYSVIVIIFRYHSEPQNIDISLFEASRRRTSWYTDTNTSTTFLCVCENFREHSSVCWQHKVQYIKCCMYKYASNCIYTVIGVLFLYVLCNEIY